MILVVRPEPGASATAARARDLGLEAVVAPVFAVRPLPWTVPAGRFDAVAMTSAQAARLGGPGLRELFDLPLWAVGDATAEAARDAGWRDVRVSGGDAGHLFADLRAAGARRVLRLAGREHMPTPPFPGEVVTVPVYAAEAAERLPAAAGEALRAGAVALLHSPRAARVLTALAGAAGVDLSRARAVAISPAAVAATGGAWGEVHLAAEKTDGAMLALAARLV